MKLKKAIRVFNQKNMNLMPDSKRSQGEIITTVLIILLVLAAIVIVWQVVQGTIAKGGSAIEAGTACMGLSLTIDSVSGTATTPANTVTLKYTRGADSLGPISLVKVLVVNPTTGVTLRTYDTTATETAGSLEQKTITSITGMTPVLASGTTYQVRLAPKVGSNQCDVAATKDFVAVA